MVSERLQAARNLLAKSKKAVCGITEREINVPTKHKSTTIRKLKAAGFRIIGTSYDSGNTTKIWFIKYGGLSGL